jgi:sarcosine oxidase subunit gamma
MADSLQLLERSIFRIKSWKPRAATNAPVRLAGMELPSRVGAMSEGSTRLMCVGPQEWLIVSDERDARALHARLHADLPEGFVLANASDALAAFEVRGLHAAHVLSKGCGLDFHETRFPRGSCARTRFAQTAMTIARLAESHFELYADRSLVHYLTAWLADAA